ncbi:SF1B family DNA helicase RecD2 [Butyrivibrio sp. MC2013]|uniref:SF1B family DNA helicase RecD2 n=1 Tax=Butyrivibrio sp. MC2013 TaxID=1280686 RepID=UPI00040BF97E|nr:ATP-dependent RecD-like DNA helicase [Butyrivibrio sp. MC2013]
MVKIRCVVERITYQNPENGYSVLKCRIKDYADLVPVVGNLLDANVGSVLIVEGSWKVDSKYGRQFLAENWEETLPASIYGMEKYLGSGLIKGVGPKFAKKIVQRFGTDTFDIIENNIGLLIEIEGIGNKRVQMIAESWERQKEIKNIMLFLQEHQVSSSYAAKIFKQYGNDSIAVMKENPYRLADDIWGIGFKTADQIAGKLGFDSESYVRLRSGIMYTLSELASDGHVYAEKEQLINTASELLEASTETITMTLDDMILRQDLILENKIINTDKEGNICPAIYLPPFYYAELGTASKLKKLAASPAGDKLYTKLMNARAETGNYDLSVDVDAISAKTGMEYDDVQAAAIRTAATAKVMVLTGGPGTGKTTTTHGIISAYKTYGLRILLAAPTGRAAKRMTEATGMEARTIHRLLECKPPEGYQKDENNPLEGDVLIVDECSMIDIILMNALLKAIPESMRLILVGDIDQLPSVGAGNVLRDIIESAAFPVVRLTRIFRQAMESRIVMNAHRINEGHMPDISNSKGTDFFYIEDEDPEDTVSRIVELVSHKLPAYYHVKPTDIQVLTPMQRGVVGATNLNLALQERINPPEEEVYLRGKGKCMMPKPCVRRSGFAFRADDKVMQIKNNYDKEVFNGDIGIISSVNENDRTLSVSFDDRQVEYDVTELDELVHAYATTIHKAQGSEYPIVVMPVLMNHYVMLQRNLIYTGITRAKKIMLVIGSRKALSYAVRNVTVTKRNTLLKERLETDIKNL